MMFRNFAAYILVAAIAFAGGALTGVFNVWPYTGFATFKRLLDGDPFTGTTVAKQLYDAFGIKPTNAVTSYRLPDESGFEELRHPDFADRRGGLWIRKSADRLPGYLLVYGAFDFQDAAHGALLLSPDGRIVRKWTVTESDITTTGEADSRKFPHGLEVLPDGSLIIAFDHGEALQRIDACGKRIWVSPGQYHHSVSLNDGNLWAPVRLDEEDRYAAAAFTRLDAETGKPLQTFSLADLRAANPAIHVFDIHLHDYFAGHEFEEDPFHSNDIEALPAALAAAFPQFEAGDLLISFRNLNMIAVVDPDTLKIKWWHVGSWHRQHDPDWQADGRITVFNNNMHKPPSQILAIDPQTRDTEVVLDGKAADFYTWIRGKHQVLSGGRLLITSPEQGRVLAVGADGRIFLEILNVYDQKANETLVVSEARFLNQPDFNPERWPACERQSSS